MRTESNDDSLWRVGRDTVLDVKAADMVRLFVFIACAAVSVAIVTAGGEINLPPAATMRMGAVLTLWMLLTLLLKNSLLWLSMLWSKKAEAMKEERYADRQTRLDMYHKPAWLEAALAYLPVRPYQIHRLFISLFSALIALAIVTDGRFVTVQYWRVDASDLAAINALVPFILMLMGGLFIKDVMPYQLARWTRVKKRAAVNVHPYLDAHLSPEIEQQVRVWAQANGISFSLAVEHLVALGLADVHLQQFYEDREWDLSFSESRLQQMGEEVWLWI